MNPGHIFHCLYMAQAIHRSERICGRTKLIIFLGTPHRGSGYASWGQIASNMARLALQDSNKKVLEALEVNSEVLDNVHEEFKTIVFKGGIKIHSFQEARGIFGMKGLDEKACLHASCETGMLMSSSNADKCRLRTTSRRSSIFPARWRRSRALMQTTCRWLDTAARTTRDTALFVASSGASSNRS
jgi:hypothetical protein